MALVKCPSCRERLDLEDEYLGQEVDCGACGAAFVAVLESAPRPAPREPDPEPPPRRRRRDDDEDDFSRPLRRSRDDYDDEEDDYDRPRRSRRRRRVSVEEARAIVAGPANGLIWTGWLSAMLCLFGGAALAAFGHEQQNNRRMQQDDPETFMVLGVGAVVFGTPYCVVMAIGGHQMKRLRGTGWGYTAGGLGIATILICGVCMPTTWAGMGFGIWAITALSRAEVRDAIEVNLAADRRAEWDDE